MNKLKELKIKEVSLTAAGKNPEAYVTLFKAKEEKSMKEQETLAQEPVEKSAPVAEPEVEKNMTTQIKSATEQMVSESEAVTKLETLVKSLAARLEEQISKAEDAEFMAIAKKYELLGTPAEELAPLLKAVKAANPAAYESQIKTLDVSLNALSKAGIFEEIGKSGDGAKPDAQTQISKAVSEIRKANPTMSERDAIIAAYEAHPELKY